MFFCYDCKITNNIRNITPQVLNFDTKNKITLIAANYIKSGLNIDEIKNDLETSLSDTVFEIPSDKNDYINAIIGEIVRQGENV